MGSAGIAAWIAHISFWALLAYGRLWDELNAASVALFLLLWLCGLVALPYVPYGDALFAPFVAVLDIALVLFIFKGDVRIP